MEQQLRTFQIQIAAASHAQALAIVTGGIQPHCRPKADDKRFILQIADARQQRDKFLEMLPKHSKDATAGKKPLDNALDVEKLTDSLWQMHNKAEKELTTFLLSPLEAMADDITKANELLAGVISIPKR